MLRFIPCTTTSVVTGLQEELRTNEVESRQRKLHMKKELIGTVHSEAPDPHVRTEHWELV